VTGNYTISYLEGLGQLTFEITYYYNCNRRFLGKWSYVGSTNWRDSSVDVDLLKEISQNKNLAILHLNHDSSVIRDFCKEVISTKDKIEICETDNSDWSFCDYSHEQILYDDRRCPLCEALEKLGDIEDSHDLIRDQYNEMEMERDVLETKVYELEEQISDLENKIDELENEDP
jgi:ABC-type methionine transport system ATPase subunit